MPPQGRDFWESTERHLIAYGDLFTRDFCGECSVDLTKDRALSDCEICLDTHYELSGQRNE